MLPDAHKWTLKRCHAGQYREAVRRISQRSGISRTEKGGSLTRTSVNVPFLDSSCRCDVCTERTPDGKEDVHASK
jgi:hypothetical protein